MSNVILWKKGNPSVTATFGVGVLCAANAGGHTLILKKL